MSIDLIIDSYHVQNFVAIKSSEFGQEQTEITLGFQLCLKNPSVKWLLPMAVLPAGSTQMITLEIILQHILSTLCQKSARI